MLPYSSTVLQISSRDAINHQESPSKVFCLYLASYRPHPIMAGKPIMWHAVSMIISMDWLFPIPFLAVILHLSFKELKAEWLSHGHSSFSNGYTECIATCSWLIACFQQAMKDKQTLATKRCWPPFAHMMVQWLKCPSYSIFQKASSSESDLSPLTSMTSRQTMGQISL